MFIIFSVLSVSKVYTYVRTYFNEMAYLFTPACKVYDVGNHDLHYYISNI